MDQLDSPPMLLEYFKDLGSKNFIPGINKYNIFRFKLKQQKSIFINAIIREDMLDTIVHLDKLTSHNSSPHLQCTLRW